MRDTIEFQAGFELLAPQHLWVLAVVLLVVVAGKYFALQRAKARQILGFRFTADLFLSFVAPAFIVSLLMIALLRPSTGTTIRNLSRESHSLFIALDLSRSMLAKDAPPSRLIQAKRGIIDLLHVLETLPHEVRVSIVLFSGSAVTFCPLTSDFQILKMYTREISPSLFSSRGTSLSALRDLLTEKEEQLSIPSFSVALFSDGGFSDDKEYLTERFLSEGISVFTYGVGQTKGVPIPLDTGELQKDRSGNIVITRLDASSLKSIAQAHNGNYVELASYIKPFAPLVSHIETQLTENASRNEQRYALKNEIFYYPLWAIIIFVGIVSMIPLRAGVLIALISTAPFIHIRPVLADSSDLQHGTRAYFEKDYEGALSHLQRGTRTTVEQETQFALGATLFRLQKFQEASQLFRSLAAESKEGRKIVEALYNAGNSDLADNRPRDAIEAYEEALSIFPDHEKTLHNLKIARTLQEQQEQKPQPQNQQAADPEKQDDRDSKSSQPNQDTSNQQGDSDTAHEGSDGETGEEEGDQATENMAEQDGQEEKQESESSASQGSQSDNKAPEGTSDTSGTEENGTGVSMNEEGEKEEEKMRGAKVWVDSLPQSPIILPSYSDNSRKGGQEW